MENLTRLQLADLFAGGYAFPHEIVDDDRFASSREVRARYRGVDIIRHEARDEPRSTYWVPMGVSTGVLHDALPTEILPDDFMPVTDLLSVVETIRSLDSVLDWVSDVQPTRFYDEHCGIFLEGVSPLGEHALHRMRQVR